LNRLINFTQVYHKISILLITVKRGPSAKIYIFIAKSLDNSDVLQQTKNIL